LEKESTFYFQRQTSQMRLVEITLLHTYNVAITAKTVDQTQLIQLSDHLEQYEKDSAALGTSNPTAAIKGFEGAHAALVNLVTAAKPAAEEGINRGTHRAGQVIRCRSQDPHKEFQHRSESHHVMQETLHESI
jgi:hypothetical protein